MIFVNFFSEMSVFAMPGPMTDVSAEISEPERRRARGALHHEHRGILEVLHLDRGFRW